MAWTVNQRPPVTTGRLPSTPSASAPSPRPSGPTLTPPTTRAPSAAAPSPRPAGTPTLPARIPPSATRDIKATPRTLARVQGRGNRRSRPRLRRASRG